MQKLFYRICVMVGMAGLASCSWFLSGSDKMSSDNLEAETPYYTGNFNNMPMSDGDARFYAANPDVAASVFNKRVPPLNSLIVCRDKQCAPAELSKSREYIFNALAQLIDNNLDKTALLCEANAQTHVCTNPYVTIPAKIGITPAYVFFDGVKIVDASLADGQTAFNLALDYNLSYNGQTPTVCKPDTAMLYVKNNNKIVLNGNGFQCDMTSVGTTMIRVMFNVDYVDLDYGYIGGYYSIGLSGPAHGGGSGYGLIRLQKDAHPLNPVLKAPQQAEIVENEAYVKPTVKPAVNSEALSIDDESEKQALASVEVKLSDESHKVSLPNKETNKPVKNASQYNYSDDANYINSTQPWNGNSAKPTVMVEEGGIIVSEEKPASYQNENFGPEFDEVYVDDLDEYIK